jgi:hypothetical protein
MEYGHLGGWGREAHICHATSLYDHLPKYGFVSRTLNSILNAVWGQQRKQLLRYCRNPKESHVLLEKITLKLKEPPVIH